MYLIVGLGNPGPKYETTRHNIGWLALDAFAIRHKATGSAKSEHKALTTRFTLNDEQVILAKPQTFMNLSGESVQALLAFYKIPKENMLVVHDDIDQPFQKLKFMKNRGAGGHNGLKSINQCIGDQDYSRLKLGIGRPVVPQMEIADYVLQNFSSDEKPLLKEFLETAADGIESWIAKGHDRTANEFNKNGG